ncbi:MAG: thioredoxin-like domain-containing protein [Bacteroidota bacterium]
MKHFSSWMVIMLLVTRLLANNDWDNKRMESPQPEIVVYVFMGEDCVISQGYTPLLNELHKTYKKDFTLFGVFPQPYSKKEKIDAFVKKYGIQFDCTIDRSQYLTNKFGVKMTPEVVVFDSYNREVIYQGRIDNTYVRVGQRRRVTTSHELKTVLAALKAKENTNQENTAAIGCFITPQDYKFGKLPMCH